MQWRADMYDPASDTGAATTTGTSQSAVENEALDKYRRCNRANGVLTEITSPELQFP